MIEHLYEDLSVHLYEGEPITKKAPTPPPITYLTNWKIVGNSEVHGNEIWSCGEYNPIDGKYHILVQPLGGSIADIALNEPLRKVNDVADTIEFPCEVEGKALVTRNLSSRTLNVHSFNVSGSKKFLVITFADTKHVNVSEVGNVIVAGLTAYSYNYLSNNYFNEGIYGVGISGTGIICIADPSFLVAEEMTQAFRNFIEGKEVIYELATPTTELVDVPQIEEADSYSMVISQGGKAVSWSSFETND